MADPVQSVLTWLLAGVMFLLTLIRGPARRTLEESLAMTDIPTYDLQLLEYTSKVPEALNCAICREVIDDPVELPCEHIFCRRCVNTHYGNSLAPPTCALCRKRFNMIGVVETHRIIKEILDTQTVRCPNSGCEIDVPRESLQNHIKEKCPGTQVMCPVIGCLRTVRRDKFDLDCQHKPTQCPYCKGPVDMLANLQAHIDSCVNFSYFCVRCWKTVTGKPARTHEKYDCEAVITNCKGSPSGCEFMATRKEVTIHEKSCPILKFRPLLESMKLDQEDMRLALQDQLTTELKAELEMELQDQLSETQAQLTTLQTQYTNLEALCMNLLHSMPNNAQQPHDGPQQFNDNVQQTDYFPQQFPNDTPQLHNDAHQFHGNHHHLQNNLQHMHGNEQYFHDNENHFNGNENHFIGNQQHFGGNQQHFNGNAPPFYHPHQMHPMVNHPGMAYDWNHPPFPYHEY